MVQNSRGTKGVYIPENNPSFSPLFHKFLHSCDLQDLKSEKVAFPELKCVASLLDKI